MQLIKAPSNEIPRFPSVFLAGGITDCPDWQSGVATRLHSLSVTVFNPRRDAFPNDPQKEEEQIRWEFERLRSAKLISFWFDKESLDPITLFELGAALARPAPIVVGIDPEYARKLDLIIQIKLERPEVVPVDSLDQMVRMISAFF